MYEDFYWSFILFIDPKIILIIISSKWKIYL